MNLALGGWLRGLAASIERGWALLIDYGHEARDYYAPSRARGTLRCYHQHTVNADPFRLVGRQDMGAHVELTTLKREAADAGFTLAGDVSQADFLRNLGLAEARARIFARPGMRPAERRANADAIDTLIDPSGLGAFRVIGLAKDGRRRAPGGIRPRRRRRPPPAAGAAPTDYRAPPPPRRPPTRLARLGRPGAVTAGTRYSLAPLSVIPAKAGISLRFQ